MASIYSANTMRKLNGNVVIKIENIKKDHIPNSI